MGFIQGVLRSLAMTLVSEIGDETFILAAIFAMRHSKVEILGAALSALWLMVILSVIFGSLLPHLLSPRLTHQLAGVLFFVFSAKLAYIGLTDEESSYDDEVAAVEKELRKSEKRQSSKRASKRSSARSRGSSVEDEAEPESEAPPVQEEEEEQEEKRKSVKRVSKRRSSIKKRQSAVKIPREFREFRRELEKILTPIFVETFLLIFLAEWGDRSQIATINLATVDNPVGVALGAMVGHAICTSLAVLGGGLIAQKISQRTLAFAGSGIFFVFGTLTVSKTMMAAQS